MSAVLFYISLLHLGYAHRKQNMTDIASVFDTTGRTAHAYKVHACKPLSRLSPWPFKDILNLSTIHFARKVFPLSMDPYPSLSLDCRQFINLICNTAVGVENMIISNWDLRCPYDKWTVLFRSWTNNTSINLLCSFYAKIMRYELSNTVQLLHF